VGLSANEESGGSPRNKKETDMKKGEVFKFETDVAVIGGGTAGLNSAIAAAERGLKVLVAEKANIARSGAIAGGIDHFMAFLETGEQWDTRGYLLPETVPIRWAGSTCAWPEVMPPGKMPLTTRQDQSPQAP
jgi:choline dehydrogenase-like flavoprotein